MRMNAAETRASSAIALCTALTVVSRSLTTDAIDTFISDVSTTSTNIAAARTSESRVLPPCLAGALIALSVPPGATVPQVRGHPGPEGRPRRPGRACTIVLCVSSHQGRDVQDETPLDPHQAERAAG